MATSIAREETRYGSKGEIRRASKDENDIESASADKLIAQSEFLASLKAFIARYPLYPDHGRILHQVYTDLGAEPVIWPCRIIVACSKVERYIIVAVRNRSGQDRDSVLRDRMNAIFPPDLDDGIEDRRTTGDNDDGKAGKRNHLDALIPCNANEAKPVSWFVDAQQECMDILTTSPECQELAERYNAKPSTVRLAIVDHTNIL